MIEKDLIEYLGDKLPVPVYAERPENAPDQFVLIEKTAGGMTNFIENVSIAIQSYDKNSLIGASELNENVKMVMLNAPTLEKIGSCRLNNDYNFTNTATKEYRYQSIYNLTYK